MFLLQCACTFMYCIQCVPLAILRFCFDPDYNPPLAIPLDPYSRYKQMRNLRRPQKISEMRKRGWTRFSCVSTTSSSVSPTPRLLGMIYQEIMQILPLWVRWISIRLIVVESKHDHPSLTFCPPPNHAPQAASRPCEVSSTLTTLKTLQRLNRSKPLR